MATFEQILCPVDFSDGSRAALVMAGALARWYEARPTVLHVHASWAGGRHAAVAAPGGGAPGAAGRGRARVIEIPPELKEGASTEGEVAQARLAAEAEARRRLQALIPESVREACSVQAEVAEGRAARELVRAAREGHDALLVMGVRGRNAVDLAVFGSNTNQVVRTAPCPVLVVHSGARAAAR